MRTYELATDRLRARVLDYGATLIALETLDRHGCMGDVVLGFDDIERYRGSHPYFGGTIGRFANRIAGGRFALDGQRYQLDCNDGSNHLHGGRTGFDRVQWQAVQHGNQVELRYRSADGEAGYPGTLEASVTFSAEAGSLRIDFAATSDRATVVNLTNHSYFNLRGHGTIGDHVVRIPASRYLPVDDELLPTGQPAAVSGTGFDFNRPRALHSCAIDHNFILEGDVEVSEPTSGRVLRIITSQPGIQFYTGNLLNGTIVGKGGERYVRHAGLCLEPQHFPDSPNRPEFPSTVLRPGMHYHAYAIYEFATVGSPKAT